MPLSSNAQWVQNLSEAASASIFKEMTLLHCTAYSYAQLLLIFHERFRLSMNARSMAMEAFEDSYYKRTVTSCNNEYEYNERRTYYV